MEKETSHDSEALRVQQSSSGLKKKCVMHAISSSIVPMSTQGVLLGFFSFSAQSLKNNSLAFTLTVTLRLEMCLSRKGGREHNRYHLQQRTSKNRKNYNGFFKK